MGRNRLPPRADDLYRYGNLRIGDTGRFDERGRILACIVAPHRREDMGSLEHAVCRS